MLNDPLSRAQNSPDLLGNFHGLNTPTVANFRPPQQCRRKDMHPGGSHKPLRVGLRTPLVGEGQGGTPAVLLVPRWFTHI